RPRTIYRGGGSVFEQGYRCDAVHVEVEHFLHAHLVAVEDERRHVDHGRHVVAAQDVAINATGQCRRAAHGDVGQGIRVGTQKVVFGQPEGRVECLHGLQHILRVHLLELFATLRDGRTRITVAVDDLVAGYDDLVHRTRFFRQYDGVLRFAADEGDGLRFVTDEAYQQLVVAGRLLKRKPPVFISDDGLASVRGDGRAREGQTLVAGLAEHKALDRLLARCGQWCAC